MIGAYSAIELALGAVAGEAHDDDPAGLDAGDDAVAEGGVDDVVAEPEATARRRRRRAAPPPHDVARGAAPPSPAAAHGVERREPSRSIELGRDLVEEAARAARSVRAPKTLRRRA